MWRRKPAVCFLRGRGQAHGVARRPQAQQGFQRVLGLRKAPSQGPAEIAPERVLAVAHHRGPDLPDLALAQDVARGHGFAVAHGHFDQGQGPGKNAFQGLAGGG